MSVLPFPTPEYLASHERQRNQRIEELLRGKIDASEYANLIAMPHSSLKGSNASFTAPGLGVITTLPFDTIVVDNPDHIIAGPTIQFSYAMDVFVWVELLQIAGDNSITDATVYLYRGSTVVYQRTNTVTLKAAFTFTRLFFAHVTLPSEPITVRVSIVANKTLTFDMTNSKIWIAQLTSNPRFNVDTRL